MLNLSRVTTPPPIGLIGLPYGRANLKQVRIYAQDITLCDARASHKR